MNVFPQCIAFQTNISKFLVTSSFGSATCTGQVNMASLVSVAGESSKSLTNSPLLYVHCLSKDDYPVRPLGLSCVDLICRHAHVSFIDKMAERRVALIPVANTRVRLVDKLTVRSPVLVSLITTCDMKVSYMYHTLLERILPYIFFCPCT